MHSILFLLQLETIPIYNNHVSLVYPFELVNYLTRPDLRYCWELKENLP